MSELNLTPKQERFCREYIIDLNGTQAAIRAGYSENSAGQIAEQNLRKLEIKEFLSTLQLERQNATGITANRVIEELARIAFSDIRNVLTVDNALADVKQLDDDTASAIASVKVTEDKSMGEVIGETKEVKFWDKLRALDALGKHFGIYEKDNKQIKQENVTIFEIPDNSRNNTKEINE